MITKDNKSLYADLFKKANDLLELTGTANEIKTIDDYFCHLGDISSRVISADGTVSDPLYFILPADEPFFKIDANTRTITVPDEFSKGGKGVSVKGDEVAETVYFSIDRYFDTTDFYDKNLKAIVQWENANKDQKISLTTEKAVIVDQSEGAEKVIFGWPLTSEVTEYDGNVTFSVRFYNIKKDEQDKEYLEYSFSTLNATVKIHKGLDLDLINGGLDTVDKNWLIYKRLRNSLPSDINLQAIQPIVDYFIPAVGQEADLDENNKLVVKMRATYPSGTNESRISRQKYTLIREDYLGSHVVVSAFTDEGVFGEDYEPTNNPAARNTTEIYYIKNSDDEYEIYRDPDWPVNGSPALYEKVYTYEVDTAGKYYVVMTNYLGESNYAEATSGKFEVKLPTEPIIRATTANAYNAILPELVDEEGIGTGTYGSCAISLVADDTDGGIPLVYNWHKAPTADGVKEQIENAHTNNYEASEIGYYFLEAINERNNSFARVLSEPIRVTYPAEAPQLLYSVYRIPADPEILATEGVVGGNAVTITPASDRADEFEFRWYREGISTPIGVTDTLETDATMVGNSYYCDVTSIYNKVSTATTRSISLKVIAK